MTGVLTNKKKNGLSAGYEEDYKLKGTLGPNFKGKLRQADTGKQPYAIEMKNADGNWESISLQRLDPISGTTAMMIDTALMLQNMPDDEGMLSAVTDASLATNWVGINNNKISNIENKLPIILYTSLLRLLFC